MKYLPRYFTVLGMILSGFPLLSQTNPDMDIIMWYDIDHGSRINARPDNGWWYLNPEYPDDPVQSGQWRTTTSLLGTYESQDSCVIRQHAYWIKSLGCNVFSSDLTNVESPRKSGVEAHMLYYYKGVIKAFELQLKELKSIRAFEAPSTYPVIRLFGSNDENLSLLLDDMYALYQQHPDQWYTLDDGTAEKDKPFLVIFVDWGLLRNWASSGIPAEVQDTRFKIRWSNGYLLGQGITEKDDNNIDRIPADLPYWLFVENQQAVQNGQYTPVYKEAENGAGVEQMITWASVWLQGAEWDGLRDTLNGKLPIERYTEPVKDLMPNTLLINRFNYPLAWPDEPQEGLSRNKSTHIEPNVDWGFLEFNDVASVLYDVKGSDKIAPPVPRLNAYDVITNKMQIHLDNYPLEFRISNEADLSNAPWHFLNVGDGGIELRNLVDRRETIYIQTRNSFGESQAGAINLTSGSSWYVVDDASESIQYDESWEVLNQESDYNETKHQAWQQGASASYSFHGTGIKIIGTTNVDHGSAELILDGIAVDTIDYYSSSENRQLTVFADSTLNDGPHSIELKATGLHGNEATDSYINIDLLRIKQLPYTITFQLSHETEALESAQVSFNGCSMLSDSNGKAVFEEVILANSLPYNITKQGYEAVNGKLAVNEDRTVPITLIKTQIIPVNAWYMVDDTSKAVSYDTNWETGSWDGYIHNTVHYAWKTGSKASFSFSGKGLKLVAATNADHGIGEVFLDGTSVDTLDFFSEAGVLQKIVFADSMLSPGAHTFKIEATGTKRTEASGSYIDIDAFLLKQNPCNDISHRFPGLIEAENFDQGGNEAAYYDTDPENIGQEYRPAEGVDIQGGTYDGGYHVGWTAEGEWLEYTIENIRPGTYNIDFDLASPVSGITTRLYAILDQDTLGYASIEYTGGWTDFQKIRIADVPISEGMDRILRIAMDGGGFNFNAIEFEAISLDCTEQSIDFPAMEEKLTTDKPFKLSASATSGLPVAFELLTGPAFIRNDSLFLTGDPGEVRILAQQEGGDGYCFADDQTQSFLVTISGTGLEEESIQNKACVIYPNPSQSFFSIGNLSGPSQIKIYSISGILLYQEQIDQNQIIHTTLQNGMYLVEIGKAEKQFVKLIIEN